MLKIFLMLNCINDANQDFCKMDRIYLLEKVWMEVSGSPALVCIDPFLCFSFLYTCGYLQTFPYFNLTFLQCWLSDLFMFKKL